MEGLPSESIILLHQYVAAMFVAVAELTTTHICQNRMNRWLFKKKLAKIKIFQLERKKVLFTQLCQETTFVTNLLTFKCKIHWPQVAFV